MARQELEIFLESVESAFRAGDVDLLLRYFQLPLVIYTAAGIATLNTEEEFAAMTQNYLAALTAMAVASGHQSILSFDPPVNNRLRVKVRTIDKDVDGNPITSSTIRYFLLQTDTGLVIEMMEYLEAPLSISDIEKIVH
ncbi:hypothetical protein N9L47_09325 [Rhodobacteraceae bacterium]|nr:hypothetical protein [Paracoccaceae bacterium]